MALNRNYNNSYDAQNSETTFCTPSFGLFGSVIDLGVDLTPVRDQINECKLRYHRDLWRIICQRGMQDQGGEGGEEGGEGDDGDGDGGGGESAEETTEGGGSGEDGGNQSNYLRRQRSSCNASRSTTYSRITLHQKSGRWRSSATHSQLATPAESEEVEEVASVDHEETPEGGDSSALATERAETAPSGFSPPQPQVQQTPSAQQTVQPVDQRLTHINRAKAWLPPILDSSNGSCSSTTCSSGQASRSKAGFKAYHNDWSYKRPKSQRRIPPLLSPPQPSKSAVTTSSSGFGKAKPNKISCSGAGRSVFVPIHCGSWMPKSDGVDHHPRRSKSGSKKHHRRRDHQDQQE